MESLEQRNEKRAKLTKKIESLFSGEKFITHVDIKEHSVWLSLDDDAEVTLHHLAILSALAHIDNPRVTVDIWQGITEIRKEMVIIGKLRKGALN